MKKIVSGIIAFLLIGCASQSPQLSTETHDFAKKLIEYTPRISGNTYYDLVKRLKKGKKVNFNLLRMAYTQTADYSPYIEDGDMREEILFHLENLNYKAAITLTNKILDQNYTDIEAHFICSYAYSQLGKNKQANFHKNVYNNLLESILETGEGETTDNAFVVIAPQEQQQLLLALGLETKDRVIMRDRGYHYEVFEVHDPDKDASYKVYFNIDLPVSKL